MGKTEMSNSNMKELQLKLKENERIRQELEAKMVQSAHYGKLLLEQLNESKEIREELEQEKHSLKLKLQTVSSSEKAFQEEIQELTKKKKKKTEKKKKKKKKKKSNENYKNSFERKEHE